jgi:creatinine amidohydrolase
MDKKIYMADLTWPEYEAEVAKNVPVFLPVGATEQHGPHLPLSVDQILPTGIAERVARAVGGLVAPTIPYGYKSQPRSGGGQAFPGTTSLDAHTLSLVVRDLIRNLACHGVKRLVLVNGHFENTWALTEGIDLAMRETRRDGIDDMVVLRLDYWDFVHRSTLDKLFPEGFPGTDLEHAALLETSMMLVMRPDLVRTDRIPTHGTAVFPSYDRHPVRPGMVPATGVLARTVGASAEKGSWLIDDHVNLIVQAIREEFCL